MTAKYIQYMKNTYDNDKKQLSIYKNTLKKQKTHKNCVF